MFERSRNKTKECKHEEGDDEGEAREEGGRREGRCGVAPVLAVTGAGLDEDVVGPRPHGAVVLVAGPFAGAAEEGTAADETPVAVHCKEREKQDHHHHHPLDPIIVRSQIINYKFKNFSTRFLFPYFNIEN